MPDPAKRPQNAWDLAGAAGSLGFTLVGCTFVGLFAGRFLDRALDTTPLLTILLLLTGIIAGFYNIIRQGLGKKKDKS